MSSPWERADTVAGFVRSPPNAHLLTLAEATLGGTPRRRLVDIGCGAARNAEPLAAQGWTITGLDFSTAMLVAARERLERSALLDRARLVRASMDRLPLSGNCADFVVAHGIWNLAQTTSEFRRAIGEARRVARRGATLFVFTFSRATLPAAATPLPGEAFVFTEFSGAPQCFLTAAELRQELERAGFAPDERLPLTELNPRPPGALVQGGAPVFLEGAFQAI